MRIVSNAKKIDKLLCQLIEKYDKYYIATAWASLGSNAAKKLIEYSENIKKMVVGMHFYQTHPDFINEFYDHDGVRFKLDAKGVFHPKVYMFSNGKDDWACVIGSANFTKSGLSKNSEIVVYIDSEDSRSKKNYDALKKTIKKYWEEAEEIDDDAYENYRNIWAQQQKNIKKIRGKPKFNQLKTELLAQSWDEYFEKVQQDETHGYEQRIRLLQKANEYFRDVEEFSHLEDIKRKEIAGIITTSEINPDIDWGWFGYMSRATTFVSEINNNEQHISDALSQIPLQGKVTKSHYEAYKDLFLRNNAVDPIGTFTRLLAMKRPDYFVCLDSKNKTNLCNAFGIKESHVDVHSYWDEIVERITFSVWWNSEPPNDPTEYEVWQGRAAMLDALFYER
jgi:HKD family nuclease